MLVGIGLRLLGIWRIASPADLLPALLVDRSARRSRRSVKDRSTG
jgi:uncharacterized membrane protein YqgA involved in biofilm formation